MSLLQNEDFVLYQLRTAYLSNIKDGVGERLISVNTSVLNNPAFRAAGWAPNTSDIKRTYSPPIPTAIASEYFQAPRSAGLTGPGFGDDDDEGGMVTGRGESSETVGPMPVTRRRRRKEQLEEEDSSDLSDDSDEDGDGDAKRAAQQIKFTKMPVRSRAGSSPIQKTRLADAPELIMVTSPSRPPETSGVRRGSLSALDTVQERPRRDTVTSSEMSSENELDPSVFKRKNINARRAAHATNLLSEKIQEDDEDESEESDLDSDFAGTADSNSLLGVGADALDSTPPPKRVPNIPPAITPHNSSPNKRTKQQQSQSILPTLPPARPISMIQPVSALTQALKAKSSKPADPLQRFGTLSGEGEPGPLYIKVYAPFSNKPTKPYEILLRRTVDEGAKVIVAEAIGYALFKYQENSLEPPIPPEKKNVNRWVLRMIEDEEVDYEFPPFARTRPITDFTSTNNRPVRVAAPNYTPRTGAPKTLRIHFISDDFTSRVSTLEVTTDTYLAEVFDRACRDLNVDKALYVLKVSGTSTIAPSDRTVEALGQRTELDLARRRFVGDGAFGLSGSPGSSSPNAPLLISTGGTPKKSKKAPGPSGLMHPLAQKQDALLSLTATNTSYKRYIVTRKQPMSFTSSSTRVLALDGEYMHIMPADTTLANAANKATGTSKTTTVHFTSVVGSKVSSKHPKTFRVVVYRERESKRYDFEAQSRDEAAEIVREIRKGMERFQEGYV
ncbi:Stress activated map kinase interacting protein sin1 [Neofusicoccum parvum]|uniref:Stress activated map kinase interacting protein sin1 n=2 Tax=Neofusicoccum parvum TaxID=310453 RepID=A0ACB5S231_9PEZI|nr:putative stress-activated map kinase-interacting protein [Neofusicoccum parvum UCRNP2]GME26785.1 Stress activated map kinase interacting protein sin1 [Neofusicoccum parvum]GME63158.1 Stress activated map kinase interacting protein sin1 [Neofusicoccum parvum]